MLLKMFSFHLPLGNPVKNLSKTFSTTSFKATGKRDKVRVVCTGIGIVCPLGQGTNFVWDALVSGGIGVSYNDKPGFESIPSKVAAFVPTGIGPGKFNIHDYAQKSEFRYLTKSMVFALAAAEEAVSISKWKPTAEYEKQRTGVAIGCGMVDLETIADTSRTLSDSGYKRVSPFFVPKILTNMAAGHVSIKYGFQGPNHAVSTACTTGAHSIGDSMRLIRNGDADVMVCGGTEAAIVPVSVAGFSRARALSTNYADDPKVSSRPFDKDRDGFVIGEGSAVLVLENYEHAKQRNATIYAEILGYGLSGDAHHMTAGREDGLGAYLSMKSALRDAGVESEEVTYVNAHATSTPIGDLIETKAIKNCFQQHTSNLKISSFKGAIGHLLGAAGAIETAFTILALHHQVIPPTMNLFNPDVSNGLDLDYVPNKSVPFVAPPTGRRLALKNSFGFGGTNASLCIGEIQ